MAVTSRCCRLVRDQFRIRCGSEEDTTIYLRYYADEPWRQSWHQEWPNFPIPEHEDPPYDRDRHLPDPHEESARAGV